MVSIPERVKEFFLRLKVRTKSESHWDSHSTGTDVVYQVGKAAGGYRWSIASTPPMCPHDVGRDKLTFTLTFNKRRLLGQQLHFSYSLFLYLCRFFRRFRTTAKSDYSLRHESPSACNNSAHTGRILMKFDVFFENLSSKFKFH